MPLFYAPDICPAMELRASRTTYPRMRLIITDIQNSYGEQFSRQLWPRLNVTLVFAFGYLFGVSTTIANSPDWADYDHLLQRYVVGGTTGGVEGFVRRYHPLPEEVRLRPSIDYNWDKGRTFRKLIGLNCLQTSSTVKAFYAEIRRQSAIKIATVLP
jgi:hypothetical protein